MTHVLLIIAEYLFLIFFQILGIGFHVAQKIFTLDKESPEKSMKEIRDLFFENEWSSLLISGLVLLFDFSFHVVVHIWYPSFRENNITVPFLDITLPYVITSFIIALVLGYAGQRLAYKYLGKAEQYLSKKVE